MSVQNGSMFKPSISAIFNKIRGKSFKIQSFTYFIPAPKQSSQGYREKQFDKVFFDFINQGFEIMSLNTEQSNQGQNSGMWVLCIVRATNSNSNKLDIEDFFGEKLSHARDDVQLDTEHA